MFNKLSSASDKPQGGLAYPLVEISKNQTAGLRFGKWGGLWRGRRLGVGPGGDVKKFFLMIYQFVFTLKIWGGYGDRGLGVGQGGC